MAQTEELARRIGLVRPYVSSRGKRAANRLAIASHAASSLEYCVSEIQSQRNQENARQQFIEKYGDRITGVLSGFDRLVFRGSSRRLNCGWVDKRVGEFVASGMEEYLWQNHILFKDYGDYVKRISARVKKRSLQGYARKRVIFLAFCGGR